MLRRLVGPTAISASALAKEVGVHQPLLSRWLRESRNVEGMGASKKKKWTGAEKLRVVLAARGLSETELGTLLRREGVHEAELTAWQAAAEAALNDMGRRGARSTTSSAATTRGASTGRVARRCTGPAAKPRAGTASRATRAAVERRMDSLGVG